MTGAISSIKTEKLINNTRYFFILFFLIAAYSSFKSGSGSWTWGGIIVTSAVFLLLAIVNQVFINRGIISKLLIYVSVTVEILLVFSLKFMMHFTPVVGYAMTLKEPATFPLCAFATLCLCPSVVCYNPHCIYSYF